MGGGLGYELRGLKKKFALHVNPIQAPPVSMPTAMLLQYYFLKH